MHGPSLDFSVPPPPATNLPVLVLASIAVVIVFLLIKNIDKLPLKARAKARKWLGYSGDYQEYIPNEKEYVEDTLMSVPPHRTPSEAWIQSGLFPFANTQEGRFLSALAQAIDQWNKAYGDRLPRPADIRETIPSNPKGLFFGYRDPNRIEGLVFHQQVGSNDIEGAANWHVHHSENQVGRGRKLQRIAYTLGVRKNGEICLLNDFALKTWSQGTDKRRGDENRKYMAVMFAGNFRGPGHNPPGKNDSPTRAQLTVAPILWRTAQTFFGWPNSKLFGHNDFGKSACPGTDLVNLIHNLNPNPDLGT